LKFYNNDESYTKKLTNPLNYKRRLTTKILKGYDLKVKECKVSPSYKKEVK
jgi:hypothetical protein